MNARRGKKVRQWTDEELDARAAKLNREIERKEGDEGTGEDATKERVILAAVSREVLARRGREKRGPARRLRRG